MCVLCMNVASEICMYYLYVVVVVILYGIFFLVLSLVTGINGGEGSSVGAWRKFISRVQVQVLFERISRGWIYKVEGAFDGEKWKYFPVH
jgi:hypothetical protein